MINKSSISLMLALGAITSPALASDTDIQQLKQQLEQMQQRINELETQQLKQKATIADVKKTSTKSSGSNNSDAVKVYGQVRVSIDNSSSKGPGAVEGTSLKSNSSRLGIKGKVNTTLGDTKLIYKAEIQYGSVGENDQDFIFRDAFVGLGSKTYGTLKLGRLTTGYKLSNTKIDPWTDHILQGRQSGQQGASNLNSNYFNNAVDYTTPKYAGFQGTGFYSFLPKDSTDRLHNAGKLKAFKGGDAFGLGVKYTTGGLRLTADILDINADDTGELTNGTAKKISAQYKFSNGLTLAGQYEDVTDLKLGQNYWAHGSYKLNKVILLTASYGFNGGDQNDNVYMSSTKGDANTWSLGAKYMLTKKSAIIAGYNDFNRDGGDHAKTFTIGIDSKFGY